MNLNNLEPQNKLMKSDIIKNIMNALTPEKVAEMKQKRIEGKKTIPTEWQFGYFVGEKIISHFLPNLSTDSMQSRKVITVSEEEAKNHKELSDKWFNISRNEKINDSEEWKSLRDFNKMLEDKYLPNPLVCHLEPLNIIDEKMFKKGLISSLWNSDICSYDIIPENIKIYDDEDVLFTIIELKLPTK